MTIFLTLQTVHSDRFWTFSWDTKQHFFFSIYTSYLPWNKILDTPQPLFWDHFLTPWNCTLWHFLEFFSTKKTIFSIFSVEICYLPWDTSLDTPQPILLTQFFYPSTLNTLTVFWRFLKHQKIFSIFSVDISQLTCDKSLDTPQTILLRQLFYPLLLCTLHFTLYTLCKFRVWPSTCSN